ncbi:50S ribosomal protein L20 [Candidatus Berkelbacteria bacterium]|nr:50S ribosomal protein L20 [Candidatus Berkelbacteria bacterium]
MARVKGGVTSRARHKRLLKSTRGYRHGRSKLNRAAKQATLKAGQYAWAHRRSKKRVFRRSWIVSINAAARANGTTYKTLIAALNRSKIGLNRKMLAQLAEHYPAEFSKVVAKVLEKK